MCSVDSSRQLFSHCCEDGIWSSFFHIACRRQNAKAFLVTVKSGLRFLKEFEEIINWRVAMTADIAAPSDIAVIGTLTSVQSCLGLCLLYSYSMCGFHSVFKKWNKNRIETIYSLFINYIQMQSTIKMSFTYIIGAI